LDRSSGPLSGLIERYWFDEHKLKTTSIVSFALKPLVKLNGNDTLFRRWEEPFKNDMASEENNNLLDKYVDFCTDQMNEFLIAARKSLPAEAWSANKRK
jgi:hypothetical protein